MIYCENIVKILETWLFSFKLDDFTSHDIIAAPLDLLKKLSLENLKLPVFPLKKVRILLGFLMVFHVF